MAARVISPKAAGHASWDAIRGALLDRRCFLAKMALFGGLFGPGPNLRTSFANNKNNKNLFAAALLQDDREMSIRI